MTHSARSRAATIFRAAAPATLLATGAIVLLQFPPSQSAFYPQCPIYAALHLECPGCGATRALAALLHGRLSEALHYNALITLLLPFALTYGIVCYWRLLRNERYRWPRFPTATIYAVATATLLFSILRNLPLRWL
jgi:Protein of unknown function (DUF2752)